MQRSLRLGESVATHALSRTVGRGRRPLTAVGDAVRGGKVWLGIAGVLATRGPAGRRAAIDGVAAVGAAEVAVHVVKRVVRRRRPPSLGRALGRAPRTASFPSSHATVAGSFATAVLLRHRAGGLVVAPMALVVGFSRVSDLRHFPSDVAGGLLLGAGVGAGVHAASERVGPAPENRARLHG